MLEKRIRDRAYLLWRERADPLLNWLEAERLETRPKLLVYLAAGACLDLGLPSTATLTHAVLPALAAPAGYTNLASAKLHSDALLDALTRSYGTPNFEHIQHGLEALNALLRSRRAGTVTKFRVVEAELTSTLHASFPDPFDTHWLIAARNEFFRALQQAMLHADQGVGAQPDWPVLAGFLRQLEAAFDLHVVTTNYDTIVEQALGWGAAEQGFVPVSGERPWRFMGYARPSRLMHLHGNLCFGFRESGGDPNRFRFEDDHEDLYLHPDSPTALATWFGRSGLTSMAGRDTIAGPIITGLEKPDKLIAEPYLSYYRQFQQLAVEIPRVLIIGYGFGDAHVNAVFSRLTKWHGANRRIAIVDYWDPARWEPASSWPSSRSAFLRTAACLAEEAGPMDELNWPDPWQPSGAGGSGHLEIYFRGFAGTIATHQARIIQFLRS